MDLTDRDAWATALVAEHDLVIPTGCGPYDAIAGGLRDWHQWVLDAEARLDVMPKIRAERKAAEAERDALVARLAQAERVVEAARAWRRWSNGSSSDPSITTAEVIVLYEEAIEALNVAVDALDGTAGPDKKGQD